MEKNTYLRIKMKLRNKRKNRKGISVMIGYILLITTAIIISTIVFQWAKTYIPTDPIECPDGVSISIKKSIYNCENKELNLTLKNNGRFNIGGYLIHATTSPSQELASESLSEYTELGEGKGAVIFFPFGNPIKPNNEIKNVFDLNNLSFSQIYSVEIIPILHQDGIRVNCADARIKEKLSCFVTCIPNTCLALGYSCNTWDDGCGGTLNCGTCTSGFFCDAIGQCISSSCVPATDSSFSGICGIQNCGIATNGTCGAVSCGTCTSGFSCDVDGQCVIVCGDNIVGGTEQCDDGNTNNNDDCIIDTNSSYECMNSVCGDGYLWNQGAGTEQCDDGNLINGDGCSSICSVEAAYSCTGEPSVCEIDSSIVDCSDYCVLFSGFTGGGCQQNPQQCSETYIGDIPGANETLGNSFCSTGNSDTCCCTS